MAISLVGSASSTALNGGNVTVTLPGGSAAGDVVYAAYCSPTQSDINMSMVTAGYTELADLYSNDTFDVNFGLFRKVLSGADANAVFTGSGDTSDSMSALVFVLRGVDNTTPEDATTTTATGINTGTPNPPSITTVSANAWVLAFGGTPAVTTATVPTNYSNLVAVPNNGDTRWTNVMGATRLIVAAGAEDPGTFGGVAGDANYSWCAATVAVRPAVTLIGHSYGVIF